MLEGSFHIYIYNIYIYIYRERERERELTVWGQMDFNDPNLCLHKCFHGKKVYEFIPCDSEGT